ncbi:MAG: energy transducer TonB [Luteimonas sp.]
MPAPQSARTTPRKPWFRLSARAAWIIVVAVALGALLFLALWLDQRRDRDFYRPGVAPPSASGQAFEPLPAPPVAGAAGTSDMARPDRDLPPAPEPTIAQRPAPPAAPIEPPYPAAQPPAATTAPVAIATPAPRYPASALRRGESGEVLLRIEVDPAGMPYSMDIVRSSGSRELDRAALVAARSWRFRPALRDGQPVSASVDVPITFDSRR